MKSISNFTNNLKWLQSNVFIALASIGCILVALLATKLGLTSQIFLLVVLAGIPVFLIIMINPKLGFLLIFFYTTFHFFVQRSIGISFPLGTVIDVSLLILLGRILMNTRPNLTTITNNKILLYSTLWMLLIVAQVANPQASFSDWFYGFKAFIRVFMIILLSYYFTPQDKFIRSFLTFWFIAAVTSALYGLYMDMVGIPEFELEIALSNETFRSLQFVGGKWRKWSFLQNSTDFGIYMATSGVFFLIYSFRKMKGMNRMILITGALIMIVSTASSGTRTAFAIIAVGLLFFSLFYIQNAKMLIGLVALFMIFVVIIFGPINHPKIRRIQSAFKPSTDQSYLVRENNKKKLRPYIYTHPHGGGLNTSGTGDGTYFGGHPLKNIPPDSYFMKLILETGWFGMIINILLFSTVMVKGINAYNKLKDSNSQLLIVGFITIFLMFNVAGYTQDNMYQIPYTFVFCLIIGLMGRIDLLVNRSL